MDKKHHSYRIKTQDIRFFASPFHIFETDVANFTPIDVNILRRKSVREIKRLYCLVKKDYEIVYRQRLFHVKTNKGFCNEYGILLKKFLTFI